MDDSDEAAEPARLHWSVPPPPPGLESETSEAALGEEFLFHLYRGSELLKDDKFYEAKSELERALAFQPRDVEGQSLLGVVYFRLGHYPRAIQIYEELIRVRPTEVAPRINLALCYLKTGQLAGARAILDELVQHRPDHVRAWGYLGLVYQRLGDFEKASVAFDRAGRPQLAARLRASQEPEAHPAVTVPPPSPSVEARPNGASIESQASGVQEIANDHVRAAETVPPPPPPPSMDSEQRMAPPSIAPPFSRPAPGTRVSIPVPLSQAAREATIVFPDSPRVAIHEASAVLVRIDRAFQARSHAVRAILPDSAWAIATKVLRRRGRSSITDEPLGGVSSPFSTIEGEGRIVLSVPEPYFPFIATLDGEPLYAREERLFGFDGSIEYELGRLSLPAGDYAGVVNLIGTGFIVLGARGKVQGIEISADRPVHVRPAHLIGWVGRLLARPAGSDAERAPMRELVTLSGNGTVLLDGA
jgi:uncharacterized protein (AIM24 family)/thioredoxin-like negative regulator of GroEL